MAAGEPGGRGRGRLPEVRANKTRYLAFWVFPHTPLPPPSFSGRPPQPTSQHLSPESRPSLECPRRQPWHPSCPGLFCRVPGAVTVCPSPAWAGPQALDLGFQPGSSLRRRRALGSYWTLWAMGTMVVLTSELALNCDKGIDLSA